VRSVVSDHVTIDAANNASLSGERNQFGSAKLITFGPKRFSIKRK